MSDSNQPRTQAAPLSLQALAQAVAAAITEAQARVDAAHLADLDRFFDEDGRPRTLTLRLPGPDGEQQAVETPLVTLTPPTVLRVTQATVVFEIDPADLIRTAVGPATDGFGAHVSITPSGAGGRGPATVTLRLEAIPAGRTQA